MAEKFSDKAVDVMMKANDKLNAAGRKVKRLYDLEEAKEGAKMMASDFNKKYGAEKFSLLFSFAWHLFTPLLFLYLLFLNFYHQMIKNHNRDQFFLLLLYQFYLTCLML